MIVTREKVGQLTAEIHRLLQVRANGCKVVLRAGVGPGRV